MKRFVLLIVAGFLSTGCPAPAEPRNGLAGTGDAMTADVQSNARVYGRSGDGVAATFGGACVTKVPPNPADADADGLPDVLTAVTYTNCQEGTLTLNGTQIISDSNTASATFAMSSAWSVVLAGTAIGSTISYSYDSLITASQNGAVFNVQDASSVSLTVDGPDFSGTIDDDHTFDAQFVPADGSWEPAPATPLEAGTISISGPWQNTVTPDGDSATVVGGVVSTLSPLQIDPTCASSVVSGSVRVLLSDPEQYQGNYLVVTWSSCGITDTELQPLF